LSQNGVFRSRPRRIRWAIAVLLGLVGGAGCTATRAHTSTGQSYVEDFDRLLWLIDHEYAYRTQSGCDTRLLREQLLPRAFAATSSDELLPVLERAVECLHDNHATLNANLDASTRLVPSGLQVWAEWQAGRAVVTQVRHASAAWRAGIRRGDMVEAIDATPTAAAVESRMPCCIRGEHATELARQWALLALLAGRHDRPINLSLSRSGTTRQVSFDPRTDSSQTDALQNVAWRRNPDGRGYISVNNLGDTDTIVAFDAALDELRDTSELFLDLRNTPGGGNTDVAEPILGRLIDRQKPYQRIEPMHGRVWLRRVAPRGPWQYTRPVTVLVSRWTGSMGEGMAIGLDAMERARICGSRMAGLNGSVFDHHLPASGLVVRLPAERLSHLDGTPRERFLPPVLVEDAEAESITDEQDWITSSIAACSQTRRFAPSAAAEPQGRSADKGTGQHHRG
jgi:carboxyl-terminal processing protease